MSLASSWLETGQVCFREVRSAQDLNLHLTLYWQIGSTDVNTRGNKGRWTLRGRHKIVLRAGAEANPQGPLGGPKKPQGPWKGSSVP